MNEMITTSLVLCKYGFSAHSLRSHGLLTSGISPHTSESAASIRKLKVKMALPARYKGIWESGSIKQLIQASALDRDELSASRSDRFTAEKDLLVPIK
jgi:hypothetical protein